MNGTGGFTPNETRRSARFPFFTFVLKNKFYPNDQCVYIFFADDLKLFRIIECSPRELCSDTNKLFSELRMPNTCISRIKKRNVPIKLKNTL